MTHIPTTPPIQPLSPTDAVWALLWVILLVAFIRMATHGDSE